MQKWDYCAVGPIRKLSNGHYPELVHFTSEGSKKTRIQAARGVDEGDALAQAIAQLGEWGWEMIGCGAMSGGVHDEQMHILYFKRPKQ
jgi:hypothetical protein